MHSPPVILVTGASRGLGRGVALQLAAEGCSGAINYVDNLPAAEETAALCRKASTSKRQEFLPIQANIGCGVDRTRLVVDTLWKFGHIDVLVSNAGISPRMRTDLTEAEVPHEEHHEQGDRKTEVELRAECVPEGCGSCPPIGEVLEIGREAPDDQRRAVERGRAPELEREDGGLMGEQREGHGPSES